LDLREWRRTGEGSGVNLARGRRSPPEEETDLGDGGSGDLARAQAAVGLRRGRKRKQPRYLSGRGL